MKTINNIKIIGVDAGYGNMKTANFCFRTGLTAYDTEPLFTKNMLVYEGRYYLVGEGHKTYTAEKTLDEDYYILTLAAIAMELNREHLTEADVYLSAGLPLSWVLEQKDDYLAYLLKNQEVEFSFKGVRYKICIVGADILPQGYAAISDKLDDLKGMTLLCDIGNGTMNLMYLRDGDAIPDKMYTEKFGTQQCVNAILEAVMNKYQVVMDEGIVESFLRTGEADVAKEYLKIMKTAASRYAQEILRRLQVHDYTPSFMRLYVVGGGGCMLRNFAKLDSSRVTFDDDICATAKGYEFLTEYHLRNG